jgi:hypothetical protein
MLSRIAMGAGSGSQTVGYRYHLGMHLVLCHGPLDKVTALRVGDKDLPTDAVAATIKQPVASVALPATGSQRLHFNSPNLFGGEDREGGITGYADLAFGGPSQTPNDYLSAKIAGPVPAYRGLMSLILRGAYLAANSPYIKPWAILGTRIPAPALSAYASIGDDANPAHIIYECLTSTRWGLGYPDTEIDLASFQAAAQTLHGESFGLSMILSDQKEVQDFVDEVLTHIDGVLFAHPESGKFVLRLVRGGYTVGALPLFDESNVLDLETYQRPGLGDLINQVTIVYRDRDSDNQQSVTVHDIATMQSQGGVVATTIQYPGIGNGALASAVASRELRGLSTPLAKVTLETNRAGRSLVPGSVFRLTWPDLGVTDLVLRVVRIGYGTMADGRCRIEAIEDAFGVTAAVYGTPAPSAWTNPVNAPAAASLRRLFEFPYWLITQRAADNATILDGIDAASGYLGAVAARPSSDAIDYELHTYPTGGVERYRQTAGFCPTATLGVAVGVTATTFSLANIVDTDLVVAPGWALIEDELVAIVGTDFQNDTVTVARGVMDTTPVPHSIGARIYFASVAYSADATEYSVGEAVFAKILPSTYLGRITLAAAPVDSVTMARRYHRAYPPGRVRVNGSDAPASITGNLVLTWSHRDRTLQTAPELVTQDATDIGPEAGVTYTLRIYNDVTNTLIKTVTGLTVTTYTYTIGTETTDNGGSPTTRTRIELESVRDTYPSWQFQSRTFNRV